MEINVPRLDERNEISIRLTDLLSSCRSKTQTKGLKYLNEA